MRRLHLFEFNDQAWLPAFVTSWMTNVLRHGHEGSKDGELWAQKVSELLARSGTGRIVDLCSGAGGPALSMREVLRRDYGVDAHLTLTDLIPNLQAAEPINRRGGDTAYLTRSIDACAVPNSLVGVRTMFSGFHHLRPAQAAALLENAYRNRQYLFIGETTCRAWSSIKVYAWAAAYVHNWTQGLELTERQRFFSKKVPVLPLLLGWDNVVSCLRTYSDDELRAFIGPLTSTDYCWELGQLPHPTLEVPYPYLMGYPRAAEGA